MKKIVFFQLLFSTLFFDSFLGFQGLSLYPVFLCSIILYIFNKNVNFNSYDYNSIIIVTGSLITSLFYLNYKFGFDLNLFKAYITAIIGIFVFYMSYSSYLKCGKQHILSTVNYVIFINVFVLFFQFFLWHVFNTDLNFGKLLLGFGHRATGFNLSYRPTGFFDEPGIYGVFIYSLFIIKYLLTGKLERCDFLIIGSILLTNSVYSFLLIFSFFTWLFIFKFESKYKKKAQLLFIILVVVGLALIFPRIINVFDGNDYSTLTKVILLKNYIYDSCGYYIYGTGLLPSLYWPDFSFQAMGDMTFLLSTIIIYGIPLGIIILVSILLLISNRLNMYTLLIITPLLKLTMFNWVFFWMYILLVKVTLYFLESKNED